MQFEREYVGRLDTVRLTPRAGLESFALFLITSFTLASAAGLGAALSQTDSAECMRPMPLPTPSYESFFGHQPPITGESARWRVNLTSAGPDSCGFSFSFEVTDKQDSRRSHFGLCTQILQIDEIDLVEPSRALIMGRITGGSPPVATIVELPSGVVEDQFGCYVPVISPDHRHLAFVKNFPAHPGPVGISNEYIAYDLAHSAEDNRPHLKPGTEYDAGWPVYPPGATNTAMENILPEPNLPAHSLSSSRLFWLDNQRFAFADYFKGTVRLVVANVVHGVRDPDVRTIILDPSQFVDLGDKCEKGTAPSDFEAWSREPARFIRVRQIDPVPTNGGAACLYLVNGPCLKQSHLMVNLP
jgi:hypothetical protein